MKVRPIKRMRVSLYEQIYLLKDFNVKNRSLKKSVSIIYELVYDFMNELALKKARAISANIRKIREYRDYTQDYLAAKLNISQNAYSKIELGYSKVTLERLFVISFVLEVNPADLISMETDELIGGKLLNSLQLI